MFGDVLSCFLGESGMMLDAGSESKMMLGDAGWFFDVLHILVIVNYPKRCRKSSIYHYFC